MSVLAQVSVNAEYPSWLNSDMLLGLLVGVLVCIFLVGAIKMANGAEKRRTGDVTTGILNYGLIAIFVAFVLGGGIWWLAEASNSDLITTFGN